jgi:hypothetical protein
MTQGNGTKTWMTWMLGVLFTLLLASVGAVYASVTNEIARVDQRAGRAEALAQEFAVKVAVMQRDIDEIKSAVGDVRMFQKAADDKLGALLAVTDKNGVKWQAMVKAWEQALNERRR